MTDKTPEERLKQVEENSNTLVMLAVGYFIFGPLLMLVFALIAWVLP